MNKLAIFAVAAAALAMQPASAAEYKCSCYKDAKAGLEGSKDPKISCAETYSSFDGSVSVQESHLKLYVSSDNIIQGDKDANLRFRPRDGKCLNAVYDGNTEKKIYGGVHCSNDNYKDIGQFKMKEKKTTTTDPKTGEKKELSNWMATYKAETSGKTYKGFAQWLQQPDGKRYMQAACIENR